MKSIYRLVPVLALFLLPGTIVEKEAVLPATLESAGVEVTGPRIPLISPALGPRNTHPALFKGTYIYQRLSAPVSGASYPSSFSKSYTAWGVGNVDILVQPQYLCEGFKMQLNVQVGNNSYYISDIAPGYPFSLQYPHFNDSVSIGGWIYAAQWPAPQECSNSINLVSITIT